MTTEAHLSARSPLSLDQKYETSYCIPTWLRDLQIERAIARSDIGRVQPTIELRHEPIAVVGFGPSLRDTWEMIKPFKYIISSSGAHRFLIDRGIIPTWHVEVDPRSHKVAILGQPHSDVTYLPASTCHPDYFDHIKGYKTLLWHVFSGEDEAIRLLPRGEWWITGGPDVGMRAMAMARFLGFTDLHIFGIDGCVGADKISHASDHPNKPSNFAPCEYGGKTYYATHALLECAKSVLHELDALKDVTTTFYGEGLVQAMVKDRIPKPPKDSIIAIEYPHLISAEMRQLNKQLHHDKLEYGVGGSRHVETVTKLAAILQKNKDVPINVLDYGCGKSQLAKALPFTISEYDPAITGKEELPRAADLVVCTDVLEHIEPDKLMPVLHDLQRCVKQIGFFTIHTGAAKKQYADGRNTHLIQQGKAWWMKQLSMFFKVAKIVEAPPELYVIVEPQPVKRGLSVSRVEVAA